MHIRSARPYDTPPMAELLNEIINAGGTTAITEPVTASELKEYMHYYSGRNVWCVSEDESELVLGFQYIEPQEDLPDDVADIATFVRRGYHGNGIGQGMFRVTCESARNLGFRGINATIRTDNKQGLAFYRSQGFVPHGPAPDVTLSSGCVISRVSMRFELN
ncbi:MAG: GNAT family N-acetyltransferase [Pseudomonadota bacterium]